MNKNHTLTILTALVYVVANTPSRAAVTVQVNGGLGMPALVSASNTPLPDGTVVELGYFNTGFDVGANENDLSALQSAWNLFGSTATTTIAGEVGRLAGAVSNTNPSFDNQPIFLWALLGNVDEYGIFTSGQPNWFFPEEGSAMPSTLVSTSEVSNSIHGQISSGGNLQLRAVPEPSIALGVLFVLGGCLMRRHRKPA